MVAKTQIPVLTDQQLGLIVEADIDAYPVEVVVAAWEELAARGVVVDFTDEPQIINPHAEDLVTVATFRNYIQAQFALTRLLASRIPAFLFDDNLIRINGFWTTALGFVKLRVAASDVADALEIVRPPPNSPIDNR